jgi:hypothetical protein
MIKDDSCRFPANSSRLLPIAAIITPAAINVVTMDKILNMQGDPPQLYFNPKYYANLGTQTPEKRYIGPSPDTLRTAFSSAMTGQVSRIPQESPNMTYTLQFLGPALRCEPANASLVNDVYKSYMKDVGPMGYMYNYMAWVPHKNIDRGNISSNEKSASLDIVSTDAAHIYIIPNTSLVGPFFIGQQVMTFLDHYAYQDLLDCTLYNASYRAFFNLTFPNQAIEVQSRELLNPVNAIKNNIQEWYDANGTGPPGASAHRDQRICYQSIMDSFGRLIVGDESLRDGIRNTQGNWNMVPIDWTTRNGTQQGLEDVFQNITLSLLSASSLT